jgi:DNA-binding transcriptional MocR family regulator
MSESNGIEAELRAAIAAGVPGARLPSVRELVARHRASPVTVQRALARLVAEGLVDARPGRGSFVAERRAVEPGDLDWQALALPAHDVDAGGLHAHVALPPPGAIPLSSGFPDAALQPTALLGAALARAGRRPGAWSWIATEGVERLRAWFAREAGPRFTAHDVVVCPGGQAALATTLRALAAPGDPVLFESPCYLGALSAARAAGLRPVPVPTDADGLRPELLERALAATGARLVVTQPLFANPHGVSLAADRRAPVLAAVHAHGAFVIEDDVSRDLGLDGPSPPPLAADDPHGHVVHIRSLTKSAAPGLRVAGLAARGAAGARLRAARVVDDFFVAPALQEAALDVVTAPAWARHRAAVAAELRERRAALLGAIRRHLPAARVDAPPAGGFHVWVALPDGTDDVALAATAARAGVVVTPGRPWFPGPAPAPYLRLSYAAAPADALERGVRALARCLG